MTTVQPTFGQTHFGAAQLGHKERNRCLVKIADLIQRHPGGTLPHKLHAPKDYKAMDRLMNRPEVTHAAVLQAHLQRTRALLGQADEPILILHDTTELDYSGLTSIADLGSIGGNLGRGYLCHNSLAFDPRRRQVLGLANQILHCRELVGRQEGVQAKRDRQSRESRLWTRALTAIGPAPAERLWVHVADRGADTFEHLAKHVAEGSAFVIRSLGKRRLRPGHDGRGTRPTLRDYALSLPLCGRKEVVIGARQNSSERRATVSVAFAPVLVLPPHVRRGDYEKRPLPLWLVVVREPKPPQGQTPLTWMLLTNVPVTNEADAWERARWYECRWVIEEYHKAQKTGCALEDLQFSSSQALQPMIALLSVVAVMLLNLREASRQDETAQRPATEHVDSRYVAVLSAWRYQRQRPELTVQEFFLALARLGGHQNRKRDHRPGWIVLWRGLMALQHMLDGAEAVGFKIRG
jgi:hypothetical protein